MELLLYAYCVIFTIGIGGIITMYLAKSKILEDTVFYILALFGMILAALNASSYPENYTMYIIMAWIWGILAIAGIIWKFKGNNQAIPWHKHFVCGAIVLGLIDMMFMN